MFNRWAIQLIVMVVSRRKRRAVEARRVGAQEPFHAGDQIGVGRLQHPMKMVGHQTEGMYLPAGFLTRFGQGVHKQRSILVGTENGLPPVPTVHNMIDGARIFHTKFSGHGRESASSTTKRQPNMSLCGTDPFMTRLRRLAAEKGSTHSLVQNEPYYGLTRMALS